uniref:Secreted protein n=1 Tax=Angiostrongylus cantonensis TaxID=6313 RepID=A0A0K0DGL5_ANGCA
MAKLEILLFIGMLSPPAMKMITISLPMPSRSLENTADETKTLAGEPKHSAKKISNKAGELVKIPKNHPISSCSYELKKTSSMPINEEHQHAEGA